MAVALLRLSMGHLAALQDVLVAAPDHYLRVTGVLPGPDAAREVYADLPEGCPRDAKRLYGLMLEGEMIGCVDLVRYYPDPHTVYLGLLLLAARHRGKGHGREGLCAVVEDARRWGCDRVRIGVLATDTVAHAFWEHMGFADTGETRSWTRGARESEVVLMEKALS